jgi:PAS domain S-box-containing protein
MRQVGLVLAVLVVGLLLAIAMPAVDGARGIAHYAPLHSLLEMGAIVVAMMVFAISWTKHSKHLPANLLFLGTVFLGVGLLDFSHLLSYDGMPDYVTPSGSEKAIGFWLAARALTAIALIAVAVLPWRSPASPAKRYFLLAVVLAVVAIVHRVMLWHPELLPPTISPSEGLSPLKLNAEYVIIASNIAAAAVLWWRMRTPQALSVAALFGAACTMALSEFFFTLYADVTDVYNLLGHVYKAVAFLLVYRGIFVVAVEWPYQQLRDSQAQVQATLNALPDLLFEVDQAGRIRDFYSAHAEVLLVPQELFMHKTVRESLPPQAAEVVMEAIGEAAESGHSHGRQYALPLPTQKGELKWYELSVARKAATQESAQHYVVLSRDITKLKENEELLLIMAKRAKALLELPRLAETLDEKSFMQCGQEIAEDLTGSEISFVHFVNKGGAEIELVAWSRRTLEHYCTAAYDSHYPLSHAGIWADALRERKTVVFNDYPSYPHKQGLPQGHSPLQRLISVPVLENDQVVMMTGVGNKRADYTAVDVETVQLISHEIWHIVQRNRSEKKLTRLGLALNQSTNEIYILDPQTWKFLDANQGALEKTGYSLPELAQLTALDLKPEFTREVYAALLAPLLAGETEHVRFDAQHRAKNGSLYPVEIHLERTHDEPPLLVQVVLDVTERKKTEVLLHEQLNELQRWQQTMLGREGRILSMKQEVNELLARSGQPPRYADYFASDAGSEGGQAPVMPGKGAA